MTTRQYWTKPLSAAGVGCDGLPQVLTQNRINGGAHGINRRIITLNEVGHGYSVREVKLLPAPRSGERGNGLRWRCRIAQFFWESKRSFVAINATGVAVSGIRN